MEELGNNTRAKKMAEPEFWELIERSLPYSFNQDRQANLLAIELKSMSNDKIVSFELRMQDLLNKARSNRMWCACDIMNHHRGSDDAFDYFRAWLISQGEETYKNALKNPDSLADISNPGREAYRFESLFSVASDAYEANTGRCMNEVLPDSKEKNVRITWNRENINSMYKLCPKLYELYDKYNYRQRHSGRKRKGM